MTTALIGKEGATAVKARVAVVTRGGVGGLAAHILGAGHEIQEFADWSACLAATAAEPLDLVFFDDDSAAGLPDRLEVPAVHVTERGATPARAGLGVIPVSAFEPALESLLTMAVELRMATSRCHDLEQLADGVRTGSALVGRSPVMRRLHGVISRAADCDATVLIEGPAGAGKSLAARVVHCKSRRSGKPLRIVDGASMDAEATTAVLADARGTTLVVEDVDRMPAAGQAVLVRHLKERSGARGEQAPRLIATTHAHLPELVARGAFREDLYYRLNGFPMVVPSLRERTEDIAEIAQAILATGASQTGRANAGFTAPALAMMETMPWPGNVAQLEAVLKRAQALAGGAPIDREHLQAPAPTATVLHGQVAAETGRRNDADGEVTEEAIRPFEEEEQLLLTRALRATKGNVRRAAQLLGIGRATLYRKIQQYKLRLQ